MPHYTEYRLELDPILRLYCEKHTSQPSLGLTHVERHTHLTEVKSMDASDVLQGRLLSLLSHLTQPKLIVEVGTFTAYATGCLAEGLAPEGRIISIENKTRFQSKITKNLKDLNISDRVEMHYADAIDVLPDIDESIDLVFIDAAKNEYSTFFDLLIDKVRPGGLIVADNTLWKGRVLEDEKDRMTSSVHAFNQKIVEDDRVSVLLLPYRDGISIIRKK